MKKKKLIALLAAFASVAVLSACGGNDGEKEACSHSYDNACDATCNDCGEERTPAAHVYTADCDAECNVCGEEREAEDHTYDNACDADCNACGDVRVPDEHFGGEATCEELAICIECDQPYGELAAHTYTEAGYQYMGLMMVMGGGEWALVTEDGKAFGALAADKSYGYMPAVDVALNGRSFTSTQNVSYTFVQCGPSSYNIKTADGKYVIMTGSYNSFNLSDTLPENGGGVWMVDTSEGLAKIVNQYSNKWIQYDSSYGTFGAYDTQKGVNVNVFGFVAATESSEKSDATHHWLECAVCGDVAEKEEHNGGEATCEDLAICVDCGVSYGALADHAYTVAEKDAEYHWNECACGTIDEASKGAHVYNVPTITDKADYMACECGAQAEAFNKKVSIIKQNIDLSAQSAAISLAGVSEYASVKSIKFGDYDLGSDISALSISAELKADTKNHGLQKLSVVVVDADGVEHTVSVPVLLISGYITDSGDFRDAVQPSAEVPAKYGYWILATDFRQDNLGTGAYCDSNWAVTNGFFGTLDGNGHTITMAQNGVNGMFGILRGATVKNLKVVDCWSSSWNGALIFGKASYGSTFENIEISSSNSGTPNTNTGLNAGYLFNAEFSNNTVTNVSITLHTSGVGNIFGCKFYGNTFDHVTISGTYSEVAYCQEIKDAQGNVLIEEIGAIQLDDIAAPEAVEVRKVALEAKQTLLLTDESASLSLGEYAGLDLVSIKTATGYSMDGLSVQYFGSLKSVTSAHGETTILVTVIDENEQLLEISIPVLLITREISSMVDFQKYVKHQSGATDSIYGYYLLTQNIAHTEDGYTAAIGSWNWQNNPSFRGTFDGNGFTITTSANSGGLFGTTQDATIKNVKIVETYHETHIISRNGYNVTFENVEIVIETAKNGANAGNKDSSPIFGQDAKNITMKNVTITSSATWKAMFYNPVDCNFTGVTLNLPSIEGFSYNGTTLVTEFPAGITVNQTALQ